MPPRILIVEDAEYLLEAYRAALEHDGACDVVGATTLLEAIAAVEADPAFEAIAVDGCFPHDAGDEPNPEPGRACNGEKFILWLRRHYAGPIIACSSEPKFNDRMIECGATRAAGKGSGVCDALLAILAQQTRR